MWTEGCSFFCTPVPPHQPPPNDHHPQLNDPPNALSLAHSSDEILGMEKRMLAELAYDLTVPTSYNFLARLRKAAGVADDAKVRAAACGVCVGEGSARALAFVFGNPSPA